MKILAKLELIKNTLIAVLIVVVVIVVACLLGIHFIGDYVQQNYIVVSSRSPVQSKQAFLWEYTTVTGDMTLATATGNGDAFADRITNQDLSNISWTDTDYRSIIRVIASTWLEQGTGIRSDVRQKYESNKEELAGQENTFISGTAWDSRFGDKDAYPSVYDCEEYDDFSYTYSGLTFKVNSARCCCCLAETFCEYMTKFDSTGLEYDDKSHAYSIGATKDDYGSYKTWPKEYTENGITKTKTCLYYNQNKMTLNGVDRYVAPSLAGLLSSNQSLTLNDLIEAGTLKPGCIITFGTTRTNQPPDNVCPGSPAHIEIVVYIDDNYVYTAGAGNNRAIIQDAILGCNSAWSRDMAVLDMNFSSDKEKPILNIIYWENSSHIKK